MCTNFEKCSVIAKALFCCVQGPQKHGICTSWYKIGNVGHQQRELRFPLGILHCHSLPPACWERGAKALIPTGSLYREWRNEDPRQEEADKQVSPIEIALGEEGDHAGLAEADLTVQSEERAMQELYRFQKHSMPKGSTKDSESASVQTQLAFTTAAHAAREAQAAQSAKLGHPPVVPPVALYANLPTEWPLARISVYTRHVGVLLRVTLNRRLAELSFRGVEFQDLPREVISAP